MCDAGRPAREWRFYISDMIEFCRILTEAEEERR